jgi:hypothetical protein
MQGCFPVLSNMTIKKKPSLVALYWERGIRLKPRKSFCPQSRGLALAYTYENYEELNFEVIASK